MKYIVIATTLHLRNGPSLNYTAIGTLVNGQTVEFRNNRNADWWLVAITINGENLVGYVASRYLKPQTDTPQTVNPNNVIPVNYPTTPSSNLNSVNARFAPLSETDLPKRNISATATVATKNAAIETAINYLNVEKSLRYQPTPQSTYCNIYAYDLCYLAQAYLPRVWWTSKTLMDFAKTPNCNPTPLYGKNVLELNANALYDWLDEWGSDFGWTRTYDLNDMQQKVNEGRIGVISAKRKDISRSGHITCVVPESSGFSALRNGSALTAPLQSQAGVKNKKHFADNWWVRLAQEFSEVGFWHHG